MPAPTTQELIDATKTTILEILEDGQSNRSGDLVYTKADLPSLRALQKELEAELAAATYATKDRVGYIVPRRV